MPKEQTIKIHADTNKLESPQNVSTRSSIRFRRGDSLTIDVLLLAGGVPVPASQVESATVEVLDVGAINSPSPRSVKLLMANTQSSIGNISVDENGNFGEDTYHARFSFTKDESLINGGEKWMRVYADFVDEKRITFSSGWIYVEENYGADLSHPPLESPEFIGRSEIEELFSTKQELETFASNLNMHISRLESDVSDIAALKAAIELNANGSQLVNEPRNVISAATGGWIRILRSATELKLSVPLSFCITFNVNDEWPSSSLAHSFFNSFLYPGIGIRVAYFPAQKTIGVAYAPRQNVTSNIDYIMENPIPKGLHTLVAALNDTSAISGTVDTKLYLDGKELTGTYTTRTLSGSIAISTQADYYIGGSGSYAAGVAGLVGGYSRAMIFDRMLTDSEIKDYVSGRDPKNPKISLIESAGSQWRDGSGNGIHALLDGGNIGTKYRDEFINDDTLIWTSIGTKYFLSSTNKILPDNCECDIILTSTVDCTVTIKNGDGTVLLSPTLLANVPTKVGSFINTSNGKISLTPTVSAVTIKVNLRIRKL